MLEFEKSDATSQSADRPETLHGDISIDLTLLTATAQAAARAAGGIQLDHFGKDGQRILDNLSHDLKIEMDCASEAAICHVIRGQYPEHAIVSEESGLMGPFADYTWIVDPLDGTLNYYFGLPFFCTSVACYHTPRVSRPSGPSAHASTIVQGQPLVGVVFAPYFDSLFSATFGQGATCNGHPLCNERDVGLADAVVSVSYGSKESVIEQTEVIAAALLRRVKKIRMFGSTALELALLANGTISGLVRLDTDIWDFAAGRLILAESGAGFKVWPNAVGGWQILAATPALYKPLMAIVESSLS